MSEMDDPYDEIEQSLEAFLQSNSAYFMGLGQSDMPEHAIPIDFVLTVEWAADDGQSWLSTFKKRGSGYWRQIGMLRASIESIEEGPNDE